MVILERILTVTIQTVQMYEEQHTLCMCSSAHIPSLCIFTCIYSEQENIVYYEPGQLLQMG